MTRRDLLRRAAAAVGFPYIVRASALGLAGAVAPSGRIAMGAIGVGSKGMGDMQEFLARRDVQMVAVCDVDARARSAAKTLVDQHNGGAACVATKDFREVIARADIDAVMIATPDHWHAIPVVAAARAGKDVFCQKPVSYDVAEGRRVVQAVHRHGVVFQHGTQRRGFRAYNNLCGLVRNGYIGKVKRVYVAADAGSGRGDPTREPVPEWLDYDLWLGPAPFVPYTRNRTFHFSWYFITDYSVGWVVGQDVHVVDVAQWGLGRDHTGPVEVVAEGGFPSDPVFDVAMTWHADCTYADGTVLTLASGPLVVRFEGADGWVSLAGDGQLEAEPRSLLTVRPGPTDAHRFTCLDVKGDFLDCVRTRKQTVAPVETAHRSTTICLLSDIAMRLRRKLRWDPAKEEFVGDAEANRMLSRAAREPWNL